MFLPSINRVTFRFKRRSAFDVFYLAIIIEVLLSVVGKSRCASQDWQLSLATIYPQFFHFAAGLSRGGSPFERNPPNFPFARVLIQNRKLGVVATIANPQPANGTLAFIKDPLVTSLPMFTITNRLGVEAKLGVTAALAQKLAQAQVPDLSAFVTYWLSGRPRGGIGRRARFRF